MLGGTHRAARTNVVCMAEADARGAMAHTALLPGGRGVWEHLQLGRSASADGIFVVGDGAAQFDAVEDAEDVGRCGALPWPAGSDQPGVSAFKSFANLREELRHAATNVVEPKMHGGSGNMDSRVRGGRPLRKKPAKEPQAPGGGCGDALLPSSPGSSSAASASASASAATSLAGSTNTLLYGHAAAVSCPGGVLASLDSRSCCALDRAISATSTTMEPLQLALPSAAGCPASTTSGRLSMYKVRPVGALSSSGAAASGSVSILQGNGSPGPAAPGFGHAANAPLSGGTMPGGGPGDVSVTRSSSTLFELAEEQVAMAAAMLSMAPGGPFEVGGMGSSIGSFMGFGSPPATLSSLGGSLSLSPTGHGSWLPQSHSLASVAGADEGTTSGRSRTSRINAGSGGGALALGGSAYALMLGVTASEGIAPGGPPAAAAAGSPSAPPQLPMACATPAAAILPGTGPGGMQS